jgi:hypothetical protein
VEKGRGPTLHLKHMSKFKVLAVIRKLCCQKLNHATSLLEFVAPTRYFDGMYSLQGLGYKVIDYNMQCHCNGDWFSTYEI